MKTIAIISQKGGTGKTTLTTGLAVEAAAAGRKTLILDIDPQANAANWGDRREDKERPAVVSCQPGRLPQALQAAKENGAQLAFIDTPGTAENPSMRAAELADLVLMPLEPHLFSLETLDTLKRLLKFGGKSRALVVLNKAPLQGGRHTDAAQIIKSQYGFDVAPAVLFNRIAHADAQNIGQTAREHDPDSKAAQEMGALYKCLLSFL